MHLLLSDIQLLAFDLDGTLIDSVPDLADAVDQMLTELDRPKAGQEKVRSWVGQGAVVLVKRALADSLEIDGIDETSELFMQAYQTFLTAYDANKGAKTRCYEGIFALLDAAKTKKIPMALITNKPYRFVPEILEQLNLDGYFDLVLGGDSLPEKKPSPMPLLHAAEQLNADPALCLMIGDSITDISAGQKAGFKTVAVRYGYDHGVPVDQCGADLVVDSLAELV
ncbi:phosphoglycolate phosphatase [Oceanospirillum sanctuarii]|uniref:phosphoglycolate phosphatase n=1 Tax=Oceanospirillum sanctuarii TaxID=1434821 RepID=UPI000A38B397|nr:phosphoglycolate phosphatase [Oceanospirillum sanctuarii]